MEFFEESEVTDGNRQFPVALSQFAPTLVGTPDEIWTKWLGLRHGAEKHTPAEWHALIDAHRDQPAYKQ